MIEPTSDYPNIASMIDRDHPTIIRNIYSFLVDDLQINIKDIEIKYKYDAGVGSGTINALIVGKPQIAYLDGDFQLSGVLKLDGYRRFRTA